MKQYWLVKSEPAAYSLEDLRSEPEGRAGWDGVRNYQARNFMRDQMRIGDGVLFYHSNTRTPGVAGTARVASEPYPDPTQFDPASPCFDPKATPEKPRWMMVDLEFESAFTSIVTLTALRSTPGLDGLALLRRGNRLSVMPVSPEHWRIILELAVR